MVEILYPNLIFIIMIYESMVTFFDTEKCGILKIDVTITKLHINHFNDQVWN